MEKRVENLEELSELLTRQLVDYNKNLIQINQNLIHEIRSLREAYSKQDVRSSSYLLLCNISLFLAPTNEFSLFEGRFSGLEELA